MVFLFLRRWRSGIWIEIGVDGFRCDRSTLVTLPVRRRRWSSWYNSRFFKTNVLSSSIVANAPNFVNNRSRSYERILRLWKNYIRWFTCCTSRSLKCFSCRWNAKLGSTRVRTPRTLLIVSDHDKPVTVIRYIQAIEGLRLLPSTLTKEKYDRHCFFARTNPVRTSEWALCLDWDEHCEWNHCIGRRTVGDLGRCDPSLRGEDIPDAKREETWRKRFNWTSGLTAKGLIGLVRMEMTCVIPNSSKTFPCRAMSALVTKRPGATYANISDWTNSGHRMRLTSLIPWPIVRLTLGKHLEQQEKTNIVAQRMIASSNSLSICNSAGSAIFRSLGNSNCSRSSVSWKYGNGRAW